MSTHVLIRYSVTDEDAYVRYRELAGPSVSAHDGVFVVKGSLGPHLEGDDDNANVAVISFPSAERATSWYRSEVYQRAVEARRGAGPMVISIVG